MNVEVGFDNRIVNVVSEKYDIVIRGGRILDSSLILRPICQLGMILVASPDYLMAYLKTIKNLKTID